MKNPEIGTVPCPYRDCARTATVHKFSATAATDTRRRFAGKLYGVCAKHGKFTDQDYILEHATITGAAEPSQAPAEPVKPDPRPVLRASPAPAPQRPAAPAPQRPAAPAPAEPRRSSGWGFFGE